MDKEKIDGSYDYFAFISYTEENTKKAQELKNNLTHYIFPKEVREERTDLPSWIRPVFEWKTDTSGGDLRGKDSQIKNALFNSKYLIVICSPHAVKSEPVNDEIQDFIKWGREKYIIPFIIDGQPHAENPEEECFPPALFELEGDRERKGIFIDNINEDYAVNSVVSTMFNIKVNDLWKPYEREQRRRRNFILGGVILAALISFSAGVYFYLLNKDNEKLREIRDKQLSHIKEDSIKLQERLFQIQQDSARIAEKSDSIRKQALVLLNTNTELSMKNRALALSQMRLLCGKVVDNISEEKYDVASQFLSEALNLHQLYGSHNYIEELDFALREYDMYMSKLVRHLRTIKKGEYQRLYLGNNSYYIYDGQLRRYDLSSNEDLGVVFPHKTIPNGKMLGCRSDKILYSVGDSLIWVYDILNKRDFFVEKCDSLDPCYFELMDDGTVIVSNTKSFGKRLYTFREDAISSVALNDISKTPDRYEVSMILGDSLFLSGANSMIIWSVKNNAILESFTLTPIDRKHLFRITYNPQSFEYFILPIKGNIGYVFPSHRPNPYYTKKYANLMEYNLADSIFFVKFVEGDSVVKQDMYKIQLNSFPGYSRGRDNFGYTLFGAPSIIKTHDKVVLSPRSKFIFSKDWNDYCSLEEYQFGIKLWEKKFPRFENASAMFTADNRYMVISYNDNYDIYSLPANQDYSQLLDHNKRFKYDFIGPDGETAIVSELYNYYLLDIKSNEKIFTIFSNAKSSPQFLAMSANKRYLAYKKNDGGEYDSVYLYDLIKKRETRIPIDSRIEEVEFSKDGHVVLFSKGFNSFHYPSLIYNTVTGQASQFETKGENFVLTSIHPEGNKMSFILRSSYLKSNVVCLSDTAENSVVYDLSEPSGTPTCARFNKDGNKVIVGYDNGDVRIWDNLCRMPSYVCLSGLHGEIRDVDMSADGIYALSSYRERDTCNSFVVVWHLPSSKIISKIPLTGSGETARFSTGADMGIIINSRYIIRFPRFEYLLNRYSNVSNITH